MCRKSPSEIRFDLVKLIQDSQDTYPKLAVRLREMSRWIADKKDGKLGNKRHVTLFLQELINDARFWLELQLMLEEDKNTVLSSLSPTELYWYNYLFPKWIYEEDPKKKHGKKN